MSAVGTAGRGCWRRPGLQTGIVLALAALCCGTGAGAAWAGSIAVSPSGWTGWWATITVTEAVHCLEVTIPSDVLFGSDSAEPGPGLTAAVDQAVKAAGEVAGPVRVDGYLDDRGPENIPLSQARADNVAAALADAGIDPVRIVAIGRGESNPVASNGTASGRAQNRRVEIRIGACPGSGN